MLNEESDPLGLRVSWIKTKIPAFNDILDAAMLSVPICGEDVEVVLVVLRAVDSMVFQRDRCYGGVKLEYPL